MKSKTTVIANNVQPNKLNTFKVRGPFVQTLCIEKDSNMDAI